MQAIGGYTLQAKIGNGRYTTMWLAQRGNGRPVALKLFPKGLSKQPAWQQQLVDWVAVMQNLNHPALLPVIGLETSGPYTFLIMPAMRGGSLTRQLQQGALPPTQAHALMQRTAAGLAALHSQKMVHGHLTPANLLFDEKGTPFLADAGLFQWMNALAPPQQRSSGAPGYLSPEQIAGEAVDGRSDFYALGAILFAALTGQPAYEAKTPALLTLKQMQEPIPSVREVQPALHPAYDGLIQRIAARTAADRPADAATLVELVDTTIQRAEHGADSTAVDADLPIFDKLAVYNKKERSLAEREAEISEIKALKSQEEAASQKRMQDFMSIEAERQAQLKLQMAQQRQRERSLLLRGLFAIAALTLLVVVFLLIQSFLQ